MGHYETLKFPGTKGDEECRVFAGFGKMTSGSFAKPEQEGRVHSLDILRGLMALSVAILHLGEWTRFIAGGTRLNNAVAVFGDYGVEGFFMVSGFCFFYLYGGTRWSPANLLRFHIKRYFRIAPLFYAAALGTVLFLPPFGNLFAGPGLSARWIAENLTFTFGFFQPDHAFVVGGWSIGLEYLFYFALPLFTILSRRKALLYLTLVALIAWAWPYTFTWIPRMASTQSLKFHTYVLMGNHAFLFALGAVAAHARRSSRWRLGLPAFLTLAAGLFILAIPRGPVVYDTFLFKVGNERVWYVALGFLMVLVFALYDVPAHWLRKPFTLLGDISYSVYLLHPFAFLALHKGFPHQLPPWAGFYLALGLTLGLSYVVYRWLEKPAMTLGKRFAACVGG